MKLKNLFSKIFIIKKVKSMTNPNVFYEVNLSKKTCSCPSFYYRTKENKNFLCKHLRYMFIKKVKSRTNPNVFYEINTLEKTCSCPSFYYRMKENKNFLCKHLKN